VKVEHLIYEDTVIAIALVSTRHHGEFVNLALRWLPPEGYVGTDGTTVTNLMEGATDWFIIPFTLAAAIGKTLVGQNAAGLDGFRDDGFRAMVSWLVEVEQLEDAMCY